jgi:hypothetical protein
MAFVLLGAGLLLLGAGVAYRAARRRRERIPCVVSHSEDGYNYPWLRDVHGGLVYIEYEEPPGAGVWRRYTRKTWEAHCRVVSHHPDTLAMDHLRAFVNPQTRFARLMFHFRDGTAMEPAPYFYELEAAWIRAYGRY